MKRGGSFSFLVGTIGNVLVMEIGWTDVGSGEVYLSEHTVILVFSQNELKIKLYLQIILPTFNIVCDSSAIHPRYLQLQKVAISLNGKIKLI